MSSISSPWWQAYKIAIVTGAVIGGVYGWGKYRRPKSIPVLECAEFVRDVVVGAGIGALYVGTFPVSTLVAEAYDHVPPPVADKKDKPLDNELMVEF